MLLFILSVYYWITCSEYVWIILATITKQQNRSIKKLSSQKCFASYESIDKQLSRIQQQPKKNQFNQRFYEIFLEIEVLFSLNFAISIGDLFEIEAIRDVLYSELFVLNRKSVTRARTFQFKCFYLCYWFFFYFVQLS